MKTMFTCLLLATALTACADPMNRPPAQVAGAKPACTEAPTGSHIVDHSCSSGDAATMSGAAMGTAMRQSNPGGISSH